jgi:hypothetical protein
LNLGPPSQEGLESKLQPSSIPETSGY